MSIYQLLIDVYLRAVISWKVLYTARTKTTTNGQKANRKQPVAQYAHTHTSMATICVSVCVSHVKQYKQRHKSNGDGSGDVDVVVVGEKTDKQTVLL